ESSIFLLIIIYLSFLFNPTFPALAVAYLQSVRAFFFFRCSSAAFSPFLQNSPYIQAGSKKKTEFPLWVLWCST
ncbi:MAG: hypothetical protein KH240_12975, partial [Faecalibacterium prausnitzii]|nr:hypothetical protein [Faecalibacterium prausnitzii]